MVVKILNRFKDRRTSLSADSMPYQPTLIERLEPRILLSGDGLISMGVPDPLQSASLGDARQVVHYAEQLEVEVSQQVGRQPNLEQEIYNEVDPSVSLETDVFQPVLTLSFNNEIRADESGAKDENVNTLDRTGSSSVDTHHDPLNAAQVSDDTAVHVDDFDVNIDDNTTLNIACLAVVEPHTNNLGVPLEDDRMVSVRDVNSSLESDTSIEIRGPPAQNGEYSTTYDLDTYLTSDEYVGTFDVEDTYQFYTPHLPDLQLIDLDISS